MDSGNKYVKTVSTIFESGRAQGRSILPFNPTFITRSSELTQVVRLLTCIRKVLDRFLTGTPVILQTSVGIAAYLSHGRFLPNPLQLIIFLHFDST